ncbi:hypothetical protein SAMN05421741_11319 [Paenimyroides ummariense]|uniref:Uncharacterized protein n=2 Tax=Paenimyroides ummariense TaxID=913024 RepID=A0A1I5CQN8_9FLAO|nr:hypothetical protein SAMN05421741_11319 [Paenimyroides ummariense]
MLLTVMLLMSTKSFCQQITKQEKEINFEKDIDLIVEELVFMYDTDQALREYTLFKTYNKAITDSIERLPHEEMRSYLKLKKFKSDDLAKRINKEYLLPIDELNTKRIIDMTSKYGFPSLSRIKKYYKGILDEEFNPYILIVHAPKKYWEELKTLLHEELDAKHLSRCEYGHILWHLNGRKDINDMLNNGFKMIPNEDGQEVLTAVDCE